jgi:hypothetical protein
MHIAVMLKLAAKIAATKHATGCNEIDFACNKGAVF